MATFADYLAKCPRCHQTALLVYGEASYRNLALFEPVPWSPLDEQNPDWETMTDARRRQWLNQLPYKLAICYLDFDRGTWQLAVVRSNEKLRTGLPLWRPHACPLEVGNGVEPTKTDLVPDLPVLARDRGTERGDLAGGQLRPRRARFGRTRNGGV